MGLRCSTTNPSDCLWEHPFVSGCDLVFTRPSVHCLEIFPSEKGGAPDEDAGNGGRHPAFQSDVKDRQRNDGIMFRVSLLAAAIVEPTYKSADENWRTSRRLSSFATYCRIDRHIHITVRFSSIMPVTVTASIAVSRTIVFRCSVAHLLKTHFFHHHAGK